jgi:hypothetical protein
MLYGFRKINNDEKTNNTNNKNGKLIGAPAANLPLEFAIATTLICSA